MLKVSCSQSLAKYGNTKTTQHALKASPVVSVGWNMETQNNPACTKSAEIFKTLKLDTIQMKNKTNLHLWSSISDSCQSGGSNCIHHVLELGCFDGSYLLGLGQFKVILFRDKLQLCLTSTGQAVQLWFLKTNKTRPRWRHFSVISDSAHMPVLSTRGIYNSGVRVQF